VIADTEELMVLALRGMATKEHHQASRALFSYLMARLKQPVLPVPDSLAGTVEILRLSGPHHI